MFSWTGAQLPGGTVRTRFPVWFLRHGQTDWNVERRFQGHADIPLNETGRIQARRNGEVLREDIVRYRPVFFSSPLIRASETMEIARTAMGLPPRRYTIDDRLLEIDLGDWNGRTPAEIEAENPGAFAARERDKWRFAIPGGESYGAAARRTREFLLTLTGPSVIVGHGASGRILRAYLRGLSIRETPHLAAPQDVVHRIERKRETTL